jgi:hypothetical protein
MHASHDPQLRISAIAVWPSAGILGSILPKTNEFLPTSRPHVPTPARAIVVVENQALRTAPKKVKQERAELIL